MLDSVPSSAEFVVTTVPSNPVLAVRTRERIIRLMEQFDYPDRALFRARLVLEEALVNAIKHGNKMESEKRVRVTACCTQRALQIEIDDEGKGFHPDDIPDPTLDANRCKPSGRGIKLIKTFADHVEYNRSGNRITVEIHRRDDEETEAAP